MTAELVTSLFVAALLLSVGTRLWLASRQIRHVATHRDAVPTAFAGHVPLAAHQKAADYTIAKLRFGIATLLMGSAVLVGWTLLGGLDLLHTAVRSVIPGSWGEIAAQLGLLVAFTLVGSLIELPSEWYATFRLEQRHGFNRMSLGLWLADQAKGLIVGAAIGLPLAAGVLWIMENSGGLWWGAWWFWAWCTWVAFNLLLMVVWPAWIAPLYNRFKPLEDAELKDRVQTLMARCGFAAKGLFVMDGSRRSAHANAYFTGLGSSKRVVFFDTLLQRLTGNEVEAVLAHELGHFKRRHVLKRMLAIFGGSLAALALLGWLSTQPAFYAGLGVTPLPLAQNHALTLIVFMLALPPFVFFLSPLAAQLLRAHGFEADAYACAQADGKALASALLKLHEDNASTLTPDPVYARFYYSHPPAAERLAALPQT
jgi:STE24 endopeptidase